MESQNSKANFENLSNSSSEINQNKMLDEGDSLNKAFLSYNARIPFIDNITNLFENSKDLKNYKCFVDLQKDLYSSLENEQHINMMISDIEKKVKIIQNNMNSNIDNYDPFSFQNEIFAFSFEDLDSKMYLNQLTNFFEKILKEELFMSKNSFLILRFLFCFFTLQIFLIDLECEDFDSFFLCLKILQKPLLNNLNNNQIFLNTFLDNLGEMIEKGFEKMNNIKDKIKETLEFVQEKNWEFRIFEIKQLFNSFSSIPNFQKNSSKTFEKFMNIKSIFKLLIQINKIKSSFEQEMKGFCHQIMQNYLSDINKKDFCKDAVTEFLWNHFEKNENIISKNENELYSVNDFTKIENFEIKSIISCDEFNNLIIENIITQLNSKNKLNEILFDLTSLTKENPLSKLVKKIIFKCFEKEKQKLVQEKIDIKKYFLLRKKIKFYLRNDCLPQLKEFLNPAIEEVFQNFTSLENNINIFIGMTFQEHNFEKNNSNILNQTVNLEEWKKSSEFLFNFVQKFDKLNMKNENKIYSIKEIINNVKNIIDVDCSNMFMSDTIYKHIRKLNQFCLNTNFNKQNSILQKTKEKINSSFLDMKKFKFLYEPFKNLRERNYEHMTFEDFIQKPNFINFWKAENSSKEPYVKCLNKYGEIKNSSFIDSDELKKIKKYFKRIRDSREELMNFYLNLNIITNQNKEESPYEIIKNKYFMFKSEFSSCPFYCEDMLKLLKKLEIIYIFLSVLNNILSDKSLYKINYFINKIGSDYFFDIIRNKIIKFDKEIDYTETFFAKLSYCISVVQSQTIFKTHQDLDEEFLIENPQIIKIQENKNKESEIQFIVKKICQLNQKLIQIISVISDEKMLVLEKMHVEKYSYELFYFLYFLNLRNDINYNFLSKKKIILKKQELFLAKDIKQILEAPIINWKKLTIFACRIESKFYDKRFNQNSLQRFMIEKHIKESHFHSEFYKNMCETFFRNYSVFFLLKYSFAVKMHNSLFSNSNCLNVDKDPFCEVSVLQTIYVFVDLKNNLWKKSLSKKPENKSIFDDKWTNEQGISANLIEKYLALFSNGISFKSKSHLISDSKNDKIANKKLDYLSNIEKKYFNSQKIEIMIQKCESKILLTDLVLIKVLFCLDMCLKICLNKESIMFSNLKYLLKFTLNIFSQLKKIDEELYKKILNPNEIEEDDFDQECIIQSYNEKEVIQVFRLILVFLKDSITVYQNLSNNLIKKYLPLIQKQFEIKTKEILFFEENISLEEIKKTFKQRIHKIKKMINKSSLNKSVEEYIEIERFFIKFSLIDEFKYPISKNQESVSLLNMEKDKIWNCIKSVEKYFHFKREKNYERSVRELNKQMSNVKADSKSLLSKEIEKDHSRMLYSRKLSKSPPKDLRIGNLTKRQFPNSEQDYKNYISSLIKGNKDSDIEEEEEETKNNQINISNILTKENQKEILMMSMSTKDKELYKMIQSKTKNISISKECNLDKIPVIDLREYQNWTISQNLIKENLLHCLLLNEDFKNKSRKEEIVKFFCSCLEEFQKIISPKFFFYSCFYLQNCFDLDNFQISKTQSSNLKYYEKMLKKFYEARHKPQKRKSTKKQNKKQNFKSLMEDLGLTKKPEESSKSDQSLNEFKENTSKTFRLKNVFPTMKLSSELFDQKFEVDLNLFFKGDPRLYFFFQNILESPHLQNPKIFKRIDSVKTLLENSFLMNSTQPDSFYEMNKQKFESNILNKKEVVLGGYGFIDSLQIPDEMKIKMNEGFMFGCLLKENFTFYIGRPNLKNQDFDCANDLWDIWKVRDLNNQSKKLNFDDLYLFVLKFKFKKKNKSFEILKKSIQKVFIKDSFKKYNLEQNLETINLEKESFPVFSENLRRYESANSDLNILEKRSNSHLNEENFYEKNEEEQQNLKKVKNETDENFEKLQQLLEIIDETQLIEVFQQLEDETLKKMLFKVVEEKYLGKINPLSNLYN